MHYSSSGCQLWTLLYSQNTSEPHVGSTLPAAHVLNK
jgi:hypothetical protein